MGVKRSGGRGMPGWESRDPAARGLDELLYPLSGQSEMFF